VNNAVSSLNWTFYYIRKGNCRNLTIFTCYLLLVCRWAG